MIKESLHGSRGRKRGPRSLQRCRDERITTSIERGSEIEVHEQEISSRHEELDSRVRQDSKRPAKSTSQRPGVHVPPGGMSRISVAAEKDIFDGIVEPICPGVLEGLPGRRGVSKHRSCRTECVRSLRRIRCPYSSRGMVAPT